MDGWNTTFLLGSPIFRGELLVSGRVCLIKVVEVDSCRRPAWYSNRSNPAGISNINWDYEKETSYFPLYWLVNRDPYNGLL